MRRALPIVLAILLATSLAASTASAETIGPEKVFSGEAYQLDNYVVEVDTVDDLSAFLDGNATWIDVYLNVYKVEQDGSLKKIKDPTASDRSDSEGKWLLRNKEDVNSRESATVKEDITQGEFDLEYVDADGGQWASIKIVTSWDTTYTKALQSRSAAEFLGTPELKVEKQVDVKELQQGETLEVTVTAENTGSVEATNVDVRDPAAGGFDVSDTTISETEAPSNIPAGQTKTLLRYTLEATGEGNRTLPTAEVSYERGIDGKSYSASSGSPMVHIIPVEADVNGTVSLTTESIESGGSVSLSALLESTGKKAAEGAIVQIDFPSEAEFVGLSGEETEGDGGPERKVISGNRLQITLDQSLEPGIQRELVSKYKFAEPGNYEFSGKLLFDPGNSVSSKKVEKEIGSAELTVGSSLSYILTHQPTYVYATPVVIILGVMGWVAYRRQQYKF